MAAPLPVAEVIPPLEPGALELTEEEAAFMKTLTGIQDVEELKRHIVDVQAKAYKVYYYPCIRSFHFTKLKISRLPAYKYLMQLKDDRPGAILLDAGCCSDRATVGNDLRKAVADGWPVENAIATDLEAEFWKYGHELFKSTPETFPAGFIAGDLLSDETLTPQTRFYTPPTTARPSNLQSLKSLTPLNGHISAIHASSFFHLFDEERQANLAKRLASLLSPEPGSIIFGRHGGLPEKGSREVHSMKTDVKVFCHSPESWKELWDGEVFEKGSVRVNVELKVVERPGPGVRIFSREGEEGKAYLLVCVIAFPDVCFPEKVLQEYYKKAMSKKGC
ncbi:hypothetical protein NP233_g1602 [Leucocoprinus birnbaumii]|uniref:Uncharacterized protein n=1 Tax=Leucocoprinus birnbaumii TaxID=56174 RepID=A0AAD5W5F2_9AGAR|nr:hypothetical protein NP233_g1602 [Leucocoprinus birnbaumii]